MSRLTRREMKRDELVTTLSRLSMAVEKHTRSILIAVVALVVLAGAVVAGMMYSRSQERAAQAALAELDRAAGAGINPVHLIGSGTYPSMEEKYNVVIRLADGLLEKYPSSNAARWAIYWKGLALMELGRGDEALAVLEPLHDAGEGFLHWSSSFLKARIQESQGMLAEAADSYRDLADAAPEGFPVELSLMNLARLLEGSGQETEAIEVYRRITRDYPDSPFARTASLSLNRAGETSF